MKKNNNVIIYGVTSGLIFVLYSICVLLLVSDKNEVFITSYVFTFIAFLATIFSIVVSKSKKSLETLPISITIFSSFYYSIQIVVGIVIILTVTSFKISLIIQLIILAVYLVFFIPLVSSKNDIENYEESRMADKRVMKDIVSNLEILYTNENDPEKKTLLKDLYEKIRYSDPNSTLNEVKSLDRELYEMVNDLSNNVSVLSKDELANYCNRIITKLNKRNVVCKNSK